MNSSEESTLAMVAKITGQVVIITDANRRVTWVNDAFTKVTGYLPEEVLGKTPGSFLQGKGTCAEAVAHIRESLNARRPVQEEILNFRKDGSPYWILMNIEPVFDETGGLRGYIGVNQDITPQKNLEIELLRREVELQELAEKRLTQLDRSRRIADTIIENSPMGIVITDEKDVIQVFNPAAEKALGYQAEDVIGYATPAILHDQEEYFSKLRAMGWDGTGFCPNEFSRIREIFMRHFPHVDEWTYRRKDGTKFPVLLALTGLKDERENVVGFAGMFADISRQRFAEDELKRQSQLRLLLGETASKFINLPLAEVESAIESSLGELGEFFEVDRAYVFRNEPGGDTMSNTHEWCAPGIFPVKDQLQNLAIADFPEWEQVQGRGETLFVPDVCSMPPGILKETLVMQEIKSMVAVPMMLRDQCIGFVGFDSVRKHRMYTEDEQGLLAHFARMLANIRMRQESEKSLQYSEQRLQNVIDSAGEFVWETDSEGRFTYLSSQAETVFGREIQTLLGKKWEDLCGNPACHEAITAVLDKHLLEGTSFQNLKIIARNARGGELHLILNGRQSNTEGEKPGLIGLTLDVTSEFLTRMELDRTKTELQRFFEMSLDLVCIVDEGGRFVKVNRAWQDLLGYPASEIEGMICLDYIHPDDLAATQKEFEDIYTGKPTNGFINRYRTSKGEYRMIEWFGKFVASRIFASARDVTQREQTRLALQRALEEEKKTSFLKANLISMASHEFRTPMASIRIAAEFLQRYGQTLSPEKVRERVGTIMEQTDHMTEIINDVLDLQVLEGESSRTKDVEIDLGDFLEEILVSFQKLEKGKSRLFLHRTEEEVILRTQPNLLHRIVGNLVQNALKYSSRPQPVEVEFRSDGTRAEIFVCDQGIGVPTEQVPLLFEPFFRGSNTGPIKGSGLGLSISQTAAERLGGIISHHANSPEGSIFKVVLPLDRKANPGQ